MPPRLMWFNKDWTLAKCHRVILGGFLHTLIGNLLDEPVPSYDDVFGLNDPLEEMRYGFDDPSETSLPFIVNVVNENKEDSNIEYGGAICSLCKRVDC